MSSSGNEHASMLASGICSQMYMSYGIAALKGRCPALADGVVAVPSFTLMSPPMGIDYFAVSDGFFGAYTAKHLVKRLHVAIAKGIEDELAADTPRFLECPDDVDGWWRNLVLDAFRVVDDELIARVPSGVPVGSPAVVALVTKDYLVLASRGATCRAVIYSNEDAVQVTSECRPEVMLPLFSSFSSVSNIQRLDLASFRFFFISMFQYAKLFRPYFPKPGVLMVQREPRDKFLILATGGLWDHVSSAEAGSFIQTRLHTSSPTILAKELAELAMRKGSLGNVTLVIILFNNF
ncbi:hypothetical protein ACQ4PT_059416 [Festuca glaucescens]